jgi:hypothetical protein
VQSIALLPNFAYNDVYVPQAIGLRRLYVDVRLQKHCLRFVRLANDKAGTTSTDIGDVLQLYTQFGVSAERTVHVAHTRVHCSTMIR